MVCGRKRRNIWMIAWVLLGVQFLAAQSGGPDSSFRVAGAGLHGARPAFSIQGLFQIRHTQRLYQSPASAPISSRDALRVRRARLKGKAVLSGRWSAFAMVDLAHFLRSPRGPGLETYWVAYRHSEALKIKAGLHRPDFGLEDQYIGDVMETIDWSQQYGAFGRSGWQSFHYGLTASGALLQNSPLPLSYAIGIFHNKNIALDVAGGNHLFGRIGLQLQNELSIGLNGALARTYGQTGNAFAFDLRWDQRLGQYWTFHLEAEFKEGTNMSRFCESYYHDPAGARIRNCRMRGLLLLPNLRYRLNSSWLEAVAFSLRTEWFDDQPGAPDTRRLIYTPHLSLEWAEDYAVRLQIAVVDEHFRRADSERDTRLLTQLQLRF